MTIMKCFRMTAAEGCWWRGVGSILANVSPPPPQPPACSQLGQARQYWKQFQNSFKILSPAGAELGWLLLAGEHNDRSFLTVNFPHFRPELIKYLVSPHGFMNITVWQVNISNYENIPRVSLDEIDSSKQDTKHLWIFQRQHEWKRMKSDFWEMRRN